LLFIFRDPDDQVDARKDLDTTIGQGEIEDATPQMNVLVDVDIQEKGVQETARDRLIEKDIETRYEYIYNDGHVIHHLYIEKKA
jgi:hypothetical protein